MTFLELTQQVQSRLNLSSTDSATRIGITINDRYKRLTSSLGINVVRGTTVHTTVTLGVTTVIFSDIEKLTNVQDRSTSPYRILKEITLQEMRASQPAGNSFASYYAVVGYSDDDVTIEIDCIPQSTFDLYADGFATLGTLSGSQVPNFPESFHDILLHGALADEYRKMEKVNLAKDSEMMYQARLSDLRMWIIKSANIDRYQGKTRGKLAISGVPGAGGGGSSVNGASSYTQTGLITFDRDPLAPFAVTSGSAKVSNLDADLLDGLDSTAFKLAGATTAEADITFTDITTNNVTSTKHGFAPRSPADATKFLNGAATPAWALVKDSDLSVSDITTNNFTTGLHGFVPKSTAADLAKGLRADGSWAEMFPQITQGRLTLTSGTPVTTADVTAAASVYFTPYGGNRVAVYNGTYWKLYTFTELTLALGTITNDLPYDVFIYDNSGTLTLELLAWTSKTVRATALALQDGVYVKTGATTRKYLGTFHTTATTTTEDSMAKRLLWNYYNRVPRILRRLETSDSWNYTTATWRQANASTANQVAVIVGIAEIPVQLELQVGLSNTNAGAGTAVNIKEDSTTQAGFPWTSTFAEETTTGVGYSIIQHARFYTYPAVGYHFYAWLEYSSAIGTTTWYGDNGGANAGPSSGMFGIING